MENEEAEEEEEWLDAEVIVEDKELLRVVSRPPLVRTPPLPIEPSRNRFLPLRGISANVGRGELEDSEDGVERDEDTVDSLRFIGGMSEPDS